MCVGVALGPNGLDMVPYEEFFRLAGVFGVTLMIFESGLHVDFAMLQKVGMRASVVAVLGTFLPLLSGMFVIMAFDPDKYQMWPVGLACGVTLAPTSVGMALKMLGEKKQLGEEYGQLIVTVSCTRARMCALFLRACPLSAVVAPLLGVAGGVCGRHSVPCCTHDAPPNWDSRIDWCRALPLASGQAVGFLRALLRRRVRRAPVTTRTHTLYVVWRV
jgi:predicted Kef-type K+ transport protein